MNQNALDILATSDLTGSDLKVFFALLAKIDYENLIAINQSEIAKKIGMKREHVNRSIKNLVANDVLFRGA